MIRGSIVAGLFALMVPPIQATSVHRIHGCVLEVREQVEDRLSRVTFIDLGQVRDIQVPAAGDRVLDQATLHLNVTGTKLKPLRLDPGNHRAPDIIETYIRCSNPPGQQ